MSKYRGKLPQLSYDLFLTDGGIETTLVFHEGYDLPEFAAFVVLKIGVEHSEGLKQKLREHVAEEIGKIARPDYIYFVNDLPKTRSGKIMRRVVRSAIVTHEVGDLSTLANPEAVREIENALEQV